jgi:hypothetical protein
MNKKYFNAKTPRSEGAKGFNNYLLMSKNVEIMTVIADARIII